MLLHVRILKEQKDSLITRLANAKDRYDYLTRLSKLYGED